MSPQAMPLAACPVPATQLAQSATSVTAGRVSALAKIIPLLGPVVTAAGTCTSGSILRLEGKCL